MEWEMKASNLLRQTYTPTPGSSCLFIKSLAHAVSLLVLWMPPADRALSSRAHWWMKPSQCVCRHTSIDVPQISSSCDKWLAIPAVCQTTRLPFLDHMSWEAEREIRTFPQTTDMAPNNNCLTEEQSTRVLFLSMDWKRPLVLEEHNLITSKH